jgi:hypothetical protein
MLNRLRRVYWDSCVFIALISNLMTPLAMERRWHAERFLDDAINGKIELFTSTLTITEVVRTEVAPGMPTSPVPPEVRQKIEDLFNEPYIRLIPLDIARANEARDLTWQHPQIKHPDNVHVVSARYVQANLRWRR